MTVVGWISATVAFTWTIVMLLHIGKLNRAWRSEDDEMVQALLRLTLPLVGVWQIVLGMSMLGIGPELAWASSVPLVLCGVGILCLELLRRSVSKRM